MRGHRQEILVDLRGTAPRLSHCKCDVLPSITIGPYLGGEVRERFESEDTPTHCLAGKPSNPTGYLLQIYYHSLFQG